MSYHKDREVNNALIRLMDALCEYERNSGQRSTLILVPHDPHQEIVKAIDGKPVSNGLSVVQAFRFACRERNENQKKEVKRKLGI